MRKANLSFLGLAPAHGSLAAVTDAMLCWTCCWGTDSASHCCQECFSRTVKTGFLCFWSWEVFLAYGLRAFMRLSHCHRWVARRIYRASLLAKVILQITVQLGGGIFDPRISSETRGETAAAVNGWRLWQQIRVYYSLANKLGRSSALNLLLIRAGSWFVGTQ